MTKVLRFLLGDQLSPALSALTDLDPARDVVVMAEMRSETGYVKHHRQKLVLFLAAMRHFAAGLRARGVTVDYVTLDDGENSHDIAGELARAVARHQPQHIVMTEPGEWRVWRILKDWQAVSGNSFELREDNRFFCTPGEFAAWAASRKSYRMEFFYRDMRRKTGFLMQDGSPVGGRWNFDDENRKSLPAKLRLPTRNRFAPDMVTESVIALVRAHFPDHFGDLDDFGWPVTREQALFALDDFIHHGLPNFGDYQDAMRSDAPFLFHALLSPALNLGLLLPMECCRAAEQAYERGEAPLNAVEGFIRQILGWREFVRGIYWLRMPHYAKLNHLAATRPLPSFYWSGETRMNCLRQVVVDTRRNAYAHHIQRLMVTGNFALLAGIAPAEVEEWYLAVYADAIEWVELPNTHGMALFADGGVLATKPYAASGAYIDKMSDYCAGCAYDPKRKQGEGACPFNLLYWDFLDRNQQILGDNPRLALPYRNWAGRDEPTRAQIKLEAAQFLAQLDG